MGGMSSLGQFLLSDNNKLGGTFPSELGRLSLVYSMEFQGLNISGSLPTEIGNLEMLNYLDLSGNQITSPIPTELGRLTQLTTLYVLIFFKKKYNTERDKRTE
eukprot:TRINITY_DN27323_c0_g1_i1.p1 TRINITY_DN27323_c0_g1~~TRINITY_DN27323_c0_g1_i1.p1  ORF type:complete len:103 (-),score=19.80 TRINITY_DN27323_c0_g1_i1:24-332(-)